jgi:hypothetical protein
MRAYLCFPFDLNNGVHGLGKLELTNAGVAMHQVGRNGRHRLVTLAMQACSWRERLKEAFPWAADHGRSYVEAKLGSCPCLPTANFEAGLYTKQAYMQLL